MQHAAARTGTFFQMGFMRRFDPGYAAARRHVDDDSSPYLREDPVDRGSVQNRPASGFLAAKPGLEDRCGLLGNDSKLQRDSYWCGIDLPVEKERSEPRERRQHFRRQHGYLDYQSCFIDRLGNL